MPDIDIIIPVHDQADHLRKCLDSIKANSAGRHQVWCWDNASGEETRQVLREHQEVVWVPWPTNLGSIRPINKLFGLGEARVVLLANSDCVFGPGWDDALLPWFGRGDVGVAGFDACRVDAQARGRPCRPGEAHDYVGGWSLAVLRPVALSWGCPTLLDEDHLLFCFGEDFDLCSRARESGWRVEVATPRLVEHVGGATRRAVQEIDLEGIHQANHDYLRHRWSKLLEGR